jgi:glycerol-3-phosphate dehydrogenase
VGSRRGTGQMGKRQTVDLLVVGGGINGAGIAREAAGRGLRVALVEQGDLASFTSSASTKLIHGGLRYLEHLEFRLVREALAERERLLNIAPHIVRPLRFVLPHAKGLRPLWQIRLGLFLYDHLGGRERLSPSRQIRLAADPAGVPLKTNFVNGFSYADCWVDDSRLVVLNAVDAAARGAQVLTRTQLVSAQPRSDGWHAQCIDLNGRRLDIQARSLVNATGCWVESARQAIGLPGFHPVRLVQGSHIVVDRLFEGPHAYLLQNPDRRVVFAIPFEQNFTLIGTTDVPFDGRLDQVRISPAEITYLCESVNRYFDRPIASTDIRWSYSGVRALQDDEAADASNVTRDYDLKLERSESGWPVLTVIGGKITTYRKLAEAAFALLRPFVGGRERSWSAEVPLPGGDVPGGDLSRYLTACQSRWRFMPRAVLARLVQSYGTRLERILQGCASIADLGEDFGAGLSVVEVNHLLTHEWALTAEDILWRRSKLGLHLPLEGATRLDKYLHTKLAVRPREATL